VTNKIEQIIIRVNDREKIVTTKRYTKRKDISSNFTNVVVVVPYFSPRRTKPSRVIPQPEIILNKKCIKTPAIMALSN
jgi:hypothetical protein